MTTEDFLTQIPPELAAEARIAGGSAGLVIRFQRRGMDAPVRSIEIVRLAEGAELRPVRPGLMVRLDPTGPEELLAELQARVEFTLHDLFEIGRALDIPVRRVGNP